LDLPTGAEVLVPSFNYVSAAEAVALLGLKPVFVDIDPDRFSIDLDSAERFITDKTKAIIPVHLYGLPCNMEAVMAFAEKYNLHVIEDAAQSLGAEVLVGGKWRQTGTVAPLGITSFFPTKNLGCLGDGGSVFCKDPTLAAKVRALAKHGQAEKYHYDYVGINSRLDTLQAAVLEVKLKHLEGFLARRRERAAWYLELLADCKGIILPSTPAYARHSWNQFTIRLKEPEQQASLRESLKKRGIPTVIYYPWPLHLQKAYPSKAIQSLPASEAACASVLSLPMHTELSKEQVEEVCGSIGEFFA
jgi:dTDP-4-amino-4,6-dideoxygalactose transaminase